MKDAGSVAATTPGRLWPVYVLVFAASACVMVIEIVAGRLVSRYVGQSLYTWTAVIGVVLAGLSLGNYAGGRLADRFPPRPLLASLLAAASLACLATPALNHLMGGRALLWSLPWPSRIVCHVATTFVAPALLLGTVSPVLASLALALGAPPGRTLGAVYAWGAIGSIGGTFLAGFFLVAVFGTTAIVLGVSAVLGGLAALVFLRGPRAA